MISNGTYLMILGVFLIVIVLFLVVVFFYLRKTVKCSKPFGRMSDSVTEEKRRNEPQLGSASFETLRTKNLEGQIEQQNASSTTTEDCNEYLVNQRQPTLAKQESLEECSCLNCSLIEMGSSCSYSDGSCPQCGRIPP